MRTLPALALLALLAACRNEAGAAPCPTLHVLAAQSLEAPLREIAGGRQDVRISTGPSGALVRQLELGAPAGLFVAAGEREAELVARLAAGPAVPVAANRLVLAVPPDNPDGLAAPADLVRTQGRIAIGRAPVVPAGRYAREALARLGIAEQVEKRLVEAENAPQAAAWVRTGQAAAGLVYASDAAAAGLHVVAELETITKVRYPAVILRGACEEKARALAEEIRTSAALERHGLAKP